MELSVLLKEAESSSPLHRIEWRDRIAAYGARAIQGVRPWLGRPIVSAFAIRVIERAGTNGETTLAIEALRSARSRVCPAEKGDIDWALHRLRLLDKQASATTRRTPPPPPARPVSGERPRRTTSARRGVR